LSKLRRAAETPNHHGNQSQYSLLGYNLQLQLTNENVRDGAFLFLKPNVHIGVAYY